MTETVNRPVDPNDFLMGGGDGVPGAKFQDPNDFVEGIIIDYKARQEREYNAETKRSDGPGKTFPSGDPIMGILLDLQTTERDVTIEGDTGARRVYLEGKLMKEAVRTAIQAAGGKGLEKGARIRITFTHREDPMDKRSAKYYTAVFTSAANVQVMGGGLPATPAPAPTVAAPVAAAPVAAPVSVQAPAPAPVVAAPAVAMDPVTMAKSLIASGVPHGVIAQSTGLDVVVIGALAAQAG